MNEQVPNCWEHKKCGRNLTRDCPAYNKNLGRMCWIVSGTMCGGVVHGTFARKTMDCQACDFFLLANAKGPG